MDSVTVDRNRFDFIDQIRGRVCGIGTDFLSTSWKAEEREGKKTDKMIRFCLLNEEERRGFRSSSSASPPLKYKWRPNLVTQILFTPETSSDDVNHHKDNNENIIIIIKLIY